MFLGEGEGNGVLSGRVAGWRFFWGRGGDGRLRWGLSSSFDLKKNI